MNQVVALARTELALVAPNYEAMRTAIARCEKVDEIANLADQAVAAQAYFRQSQDVDNEMHASRIRVRAERRLGEILKRMAENGERATKGERAANVAPRDISTLDDLGIPRDRASRAMQFLTCRDMSETFHGVTPKVKRTLHMQSIYLEPAKAEVLDRLATRSRIPKAVLLREAVDDLLVKHKALKAPKRKG